MSLALISGDGGRMRSRCRVRCFFLPLHMCENRKLMPLRNMNPVYYPVTYQPSHAPDWWDKGILRKGSKFCAYGSAAGGVHTIVAHTVSFSQGLERKFILPIFAPPTRAAR